MFIRTTSLLACLLVPISASASITLDIYAERLETSTGDPMPTTGLVILAASTLDSTFGAPTPSSFFSGDDIEVARWSLDSGFGPGIFNKAPVLTLSGNWNANDPLQLYWFPENTVSDTTPIAGQSYGVFRDDIEVPLASHDAWITPADGSTASLRFYTTDAGSNDGVVYPASAGQASLTVVPEPSAFAAVAGLGCFAWALFFRGRKKAGIDLPN
jgi:hypothetical protein